MLEIGNRFYNAKDIRYIARNNRGNVCIEFVNGDYIHTDNFYGDYAFEELLKKWESKLNL